MIIVHVYATYKQAYHISLRTTPEVLSFGTTTPQGQKTIGLGDARHIIRTRSLIKLDYDLIFA